MTEQSTVPTIPGVFSRQASGLVRVGGAWDALIYNVFNNSIGLGIVYNQFFGPSAYPGARPALSTLFVALGLASVAVTFYFWAVTLPRSGGNYVFLTRTGSPGVGFVISLLEVVTLMYFAGLAATLVV